MCNIYKKYIDIPVRQCYKRNMSCYKLGVFEKRCNVLAGEKRTLVTDTYLKMKNMIVSKKWIVGSRIPGEEELSKQFHVSRNTIRCALQKLNALGMIETRHGSGSYVVRIVENENLSMAFQSYQLSHKKIVEILEFRRGVESESTYLAAIRGDESDLTKIRLAALKMMESIHNFRNYSDADLEFHLAIARAAKNELFYTQMVNLKDMLETHFVEMNSSIGTQFSANDHWNIYLAIERREAELAKMVMYSTIDRSIKVLMENSE